MKYKDNDWIIAFTIFCLGFLLLLSLFYNNYSKNKLINNYSCYINHVQECQDCHSQNLTYLLCSGFCVKPSVQDLDDKGCPVIHPSRNCFDLPKECNF